MNFEVLGISVFTQLKCQMRIIDIFKAVPSQPKLEVSIFTVPPVSFFLKLKRPTMCVYLSVCLCVRLIKGTRWF